MTEQVLSPAELVTAAWNRGQTMSENFITRTQGFFDDAMRLAEEGAAMVPAAVSFTVDVQEPEVAIPTMAEGNTLVQFDQRSEAMMSKLAAQFAAFIGEYFPNECDYLGKAQTWICNAIQNGGTGIKPAVEQQIWERDRNRILKDAQRQESDLVRSYAAKGFPMPPGALFAATQRLRSDAGDRIAQASRDVAIKQAEMEVENVRFAVEKAVTLYGNVMDAARGYIAAMAGTFNVAAQVIPSVTDSQSRLISAASEYYRARISVEDLRLRATLMPAEFAQQANAKNLDAQLSIIKNKVDAAVQAAQALSAQAAAMLNALHVSTSTSASGSKSVSYGYSGGVTEDVVPQTT
ncbi:hypothetical protein [Comamonas aquatica]|uniref:hypothetical protein n=1 Tax=Comamonas aquatica TaxID=225991 RepID=UPI0034D49BFA